MTLKETLDALCTGRRIHISLRDSDRMLADGDCKLPFHYEVHDCPFCNAAKSTPEGYACCVQHKVRVNRLAVKHGRPFWGCCPYGVPELVWPVVLGGRVVCVIYLGNFAPREDRLEEACRRTGVSPEVLRRAAETCEPGSPEDYRSTAELLDGLLKQQLSQSRGKSPSREHPAVRRAREYAENFFDKDVRMEQLAEQYGLNPKYFGRLFKQQTGVSFSGYLSDLRLSHAARLLESGSVVHAALSSGFNEITYFNHVFKKKYGVSPTEYKNGTRSGSDR